ncbi:retrovirus-related pol polyprotein from transposon TNT 1-94 [Tanacetum coccineum]
MDELIVHVSEKTYAYGAIRAENQNLLFTISELKTRLANVEKENGCSKSKENHVVSKPVTLQTSPAKQSGVNSNKNVIAPGMYKVVTTHESQTNEAKHDLSSTGINAASSVRRPMNRDSHVKNSVLANSKKPAKKVAVYVRKNKQTDITSENVISNKENVIDVDVANASKAKTLLCVSCMQNVLIPCHDNCFANYKLNVHSNVRRTLSTKSRTPKSYDTTYVVHKTRFSKESTLSKSLDTTYVVSKPKIDVGSTSKANDKVVQIASVDSRICKIRTDNGTEFKNATLKAYYKKLGIMQQFSIAHTPQQNGVVERRNRTLVEAARTMLIFSRLPEFLWTEAPVVQTLFMLLLYVLVIKHVLRSTNLKRGEKLVSWSSKKQDCTAMSTAEAEYVSLSACWSTISLCVKQLLRIMIQYNRIPMHCDSKSAIAISCNPVQHSKTKHIGIRYHFIKEHVEKGTVELYFVGTKYQLADLFTKALPKKCFEYLGSSHWYDMYDSNSVGKSDKEGLQYSLHHPTSSIPYPRFTKIIISHYMTNFPEISRRARDRYHNLKDDDIMKNIFNSGRYKDKVGMKIPTWMISEEIKHTEHYRMYMGVFGIDVPLTQSQLTESTQGMHRTPSAPRSPNPNMDVGVSSAPKRLTMIHFRIPQRRSTRLTPPAPVPTIDKADEMILQDTLQVSLAEHKSREEQEARENVELVNENLASVEIEKMVEGPENVIDDSSIPRNDDQNILDTRLEPRSDKESPEVEITNDKEVEITNFVILVNVNEEEEEITDEVYELIIEGVTEDYKHIKEQVEKQVPEQVKVQVLVYVAKGMLLERRQNKEEIDKMIAKAIIQVNASVPLKLTCRTSVVRPKSSGTILMMDAHLRGRIVQRGRKDSEFEAYVTGVSSRQVNEKRQDDDFLDRVTLFGKSEGNFLLSTSLERPHLCFKAVQRDLDSS